MIYIEKDQEILEDKNMRVITNSGNYEDQALIEVYNIIDPEVIAGSFQAQYIKYGNLVYQFNDPKQLGEEILKIDPESTHTAASYVRMTNELLFQMNGGTLEPESLDEVISSEQQIMEEKIEEPFLDNQKEEVPEETVAEEIPEDTTIQESINEVEKIAEDVLPESPSLEEEIPTETIIEENAIEPEVIDVGEVIEAEIVPDNNTSASLSEEIISYARNRKSSKLKIKNRA